MDTVTELRPQSSVEKLPIIDADFHPMPIPSDPQIAVHMSQRWRDYVANYGMGHSYSGLYAPSQREWTHRLDAMKGGRVGVDPHWAREQVLDKYDMSGVVLTWVTVASELSATVVLYSGPWRTMTVVMFQALEGSGAGIATAAAAIPALVPSRAWNIATVMVVHGPL